MRIAVASQGMEKTSNVDPRFGRASHFLIFDTNDESFEVLSNNQNVNTAQGAGIQAAEFVAAQNVDIVVAGNFGPKAFGALGAAGISVALWADGTVADAIKLARENKLKISDKANVEGHWM
ncbi:MAG: NifB/NifX family molybdenum-iron cluster-binding protein [candidate division Zixibacteria bacterium]|jgi:predicted Fe-Mo cluster-binding NifX family protein|nr:NifB/NifX family molybdenum-iron cluster-binding protein [candidate division Zixibacteria bacterium]